MAFKSFATFNFGSMANNRWITIKAKLLSSLLHSSILTYTAGVIE